MQLIAMNIAHITTSYAIYKYIHQWTKYRGIDGDGDGNCDGEIG